jgi:hypothetical protein
MSASIAESLKRFTPAGDGLDPAAILIAAGRAAVRPQRWWMILAGALAVSQIAILVALWPEPPVVEQRFIVKKPVAPIVDSEPAAPAPAPTMLEAFHRELLDSDQQGPGPETVNFAGPDEPPMRASPACLNSLLD